MDTATAIGSVLAAFGLSGAAGLNAWIPLFGAGLLARLGWVDLGSAYDWLESTPALILTGLALCVDLVADKIPAVDHVMHVIGVAVHPVSGAVLFAAQAGVGSDLPGIVSLVLGAVVAGGLHGARASVRPAVTTTTAGVGNPVVSAVEDGVSLVLTILAFVLPLLAVLLLVAIAVALVRAGARLGRRPARE